MESVGATWKSPASSVNATSEDSATESLKPPASSICSPASNELSQAPPATLPLLQADKLNAATKYVATHRPQSLEWGPSEGIGLDIVEGVRRVKSHDGPNLIRSGSFTLTSTVLGTGKRFGTPARAFELVTTTAMPTGIILNTYKVAGPLKTG